jgi:hypothetical protein
MRHTGVNHINNASFPLSCEFGFSTQTSHCSGQKKIEKISEDAQGKMKIERIKNTEPFAGVVAAQINDCSNCLSCEEDLDVC